MNSDSSAMDLDLGKILQDAAIKGNVDSLNEALGKDDLILDRFTAANSFVHTPLHTAAFKGHSNFVQRLLSENPALASVLDDRRRSALHLAAEQGHCHLVKDLVDASPEMCVAVDGDGRNPLHLAAVKGQFHLVKDLVDSSPEMCVAVDRDGRNPLHLAAVMGHHAVAEELLSAQPRMVHEMLSTKDAKDETVLHLAVKNTQFEVVKRMLECIEKHVVKGKAEYYNDEQALNVVERMLKHMEHVGKGKAEEYYEQALNTINKCGCTVLDIILETKSDENHFESINNLLRRMGCSRAIEVNEDIEWLSKKREALMVVASLIATMTFQATLNPPGGYWQDTKDGHKAGESVMAFNLPNLYKSYLFASWNGFYGSISTIIMLVGIRHFKANMWLRRLLVGMIYLTVYSTAVAYMIGTMVMKYSKKGSRNIPDSFIYAELIWFTYFGCFLLFQVATLRGEYSRRKRWASTRNKDKSNKPFSSTEDQGQQTKNLELAISDGNNDQVPCSAIPNNQDLDFEEGIHQCDTVQ